MQSCPHAGGYAVAVTGRLMSSFEIIFDVILFGKLVVHYFLLITRKIRIILM